MTDGEVLALLRKAHNLTENGLATACELSRNTISRLERGRLTITPKIIGILANTYGINSVTMARLFRELSDYDIYKPSDHRKALYIITSKFE